MSKKEILVPFIAPLNADDTETQTYGCRQNNPDICGKNCMPDICAFVRKDNICKSPSRAWKRQYLQLKEETNS